jgi:hypothetical protein
MKLSARFDMRALSRGFARVARTIEQTALDAAADALADELARVRASEGLHAPLVREQSERRRLIGANDPESIAREFGTRDQTPMPWLAPFLPKVRTSAPMWAVTFKVIARAFFGNRP